MLKIHRDPEQWYDFGWEDGFGLVPSVGVQFFEDPDNAAAYLQGYEDGRFAREIGYIDMGGES